MEKIIYSGPADFRFNYKAFYDIFQDMPDAELVQNMHTTTPAQSYQTWLVQGVAVNWSTPGCVFDECEVKLVGEEKAISDVERRIFGSKDQLSFKL